MRTPMLVLALALLPATAAATPNATVVVGSVALASFEQVSDDGCVTTFGEIAVLETRHGNGELADGLYVTGMQEDTCAGTGNGFAGYAEGDLTIVGLIYARFTGEIVVESYSGGAPVTVELDLRWWGHGAVHRERSWFRDDSVIEFSYSAYRDATTTGTFTLDGDDVTVTSARIGRQASGTITN